jgi:hypothetical protein
MGCKHCSCIGQGQVPKDEEDLEVIDMEESKERLKESNIRMMFEPPDIEKFRASMITSSSEQIKIAEERIFTSEFSQGDAKNEEIKENDKICSGIRTNQKRKSGGIYDKKHYFIARRG